MAEDKKFEYEVIPLNGKWRPSVDGTQMEKGDFQTLTNMRYTDTGIKSVSGMTKINTSVINSTYLKTRAAHQFKKSNPADSATPNESNVLVQSWDAGEAGSRVYKNTTAIPSAGNFTATAIFADSSGSDRGRFSDAPDGCVAYCNGKEACVWGGTEYRVASLFTASPAVAASGTLTSTADITHDGDVITVDAKVYTFKTALTPTEGEILIGGSAAAALDNFKSAVNHTGTPDTDYKCAAVHPTVTATTNTNTTQLIVANTSGSAGNGIATTVTGGSGHLSWGGTSLAGGVNVGVSYFQDYTGQVNNDLTDATNVAKFNQNPLTVYLGSTRPITGAKFYIGTINDSAATVAVSYWNSSGAWASVSSLVDGTLTGGKSLSVTEGSITFTDGSSSTYGNARPKFINDIYLYWYKFVWTGLNTATTVYRITVNAPFQPIVDLWSGIPVGIASCYDLTGSTYTDHLISVLERDFVSGTVATWLNLSTLATTVSLFFGFPNRMSALEFAIPAGNTTVSTMTLSYWSGSAWTSAVGLDDQTSVDGKSFGQNGKVSWTAPAENSEFPISINGGPMLFHYKVAFSATLSGTVALDYVTGMPTQKSIKGYKFPVYWQSNLCLCSETSSDKNKILIGSNDSVCVFNGTSYAEVYLGDNSELTAGAALFSRFGGYLYEDLIIAKENEIWLISGTNVSNIQKYRIAGAYGCVAPSTFIKCDLGYEVAPGINKHVLIWQTATAVVLFDGVSIIPITKDDDVGIFFNKTYASCINNAMLKKSVGFYDERQKEYHWLFASGSNTTLDKELVYDLIRKKWYLVSRTSNIQYGIPVRDVYGDKYTYGFIDTGYMERLEYGNTFDSTAIVSTYKTADYALKGLMVETEIRKIKHVTKAKSTTTNTASLTHYGDTATTGDTAQTFTVNSTTKRVIGDAPNAIKSVAWGPNIFHSFEASMTTNNEPIGYEPISLAVLYRSIRQDII
jgi:hypothetical protein